MLIAIDKIIPDPNQPRKTFHEETLEELKESLSGVGLINPLTVRAVDGNRYMVIVGERRYRASLKAGIKEIECIVRDDVDDKTVREMQFNENYHFEKISPIEQARGWYEHRKKYNLTQEQMAKIIGIHQATISDHEGLLRLEPEIMAMAIKGELPFHEAHKVASIKEPKRQKEVARAFIEEGPKLYRKRDEFISAVQKEPTRPVDDIIAEVVYGIEIPERPKVQKSTAEELDEIIQIATKLLGKIDRLMAKGIDLKPVALDLYMLANSFNELAKKAGG